LKPGFRGIETSRTRFGDRPNRQNHGVSHLHERVERRDGFVHRFAVTRLDKCEPVLLDDAHDFAELAFAHEVDEGLDDPIRLLQCARGAKVGRAQRIAAALLKLSCQHFRKELMVPDHTVAPYEEIRRGALHAREPFCGVIVTGRGEKPGIDLGKYGGFQYQRSFAWCERLHRFARKALERIGRAREEPFGCAGPRPQRAQTERIGRWRTVRRRVQQIDDPTVERRRQALRDAVRFVIFPGERSSRPKARRYRDARATSRSADRP